MTVNLIRIRNTRLNAPHAVIGSIRLKDILIYTMEKLWVLDQKYPRQGKSLQSCVPAGVYDVQNISSLQMYLESTSNGIFCNSSSDKGRFECGIGISERTKSGEPNIIPGLSLAMVDTKMRPVQIDIACSLLAEEFRKDPRLSISWE